MFNELLSVIVAIYNAQEYLDSCIKSIINQSYKNIEIILVDDGSEDQSLGICEKYARCDKRVKVIHQDNRGQMYANYAGIRIAQGKYVTFVDADDYIDEWLYEKEMQYVMSCNVDMLCAGYIREAQGESLRVENSFKPGFYDEQSINEIIAPDMMFHRKTKRHGIDASKCTKIFTKDILLPILEDEDFQITIGEDIAVVYQYIMKCKSLFLAEIYGYHYVERKGSITTNVKWGDFEKLFILKNHLMKTLGARFRCQIDFYVYSLLGERINKIYDINIIAYEPPVELLISKSKVVLYGAGNVGVGYYKYLMHKSIVEIVAWADTKVRQYLEYKIIAPEEILGLKYDTILIAITDEKIAENIMENLVSIGIDRDKIIWRKPEMLIL